MGEFRASYFKNRIKPYLEQSETYQEIIKQFPDRIIPTDIEPVTLLHRIVKTVQNLIFIDKTYSIQYLQSYCS